MPLIVWRVKATGLPFSVIPLSDPPTTTVGSIACRPFAPVPTATLKVSTLPLHVIDWNDDPLRPSSQVSIWRALTTGTPRDCADATIASDPIDPSDGLKSVCMFAV